MRKELAEQLLKLADGVIAAEQEALVRENLPHPSGKNLFADQRQELHERFAEKLAQLPDDQFETTRNQFQKLGPIAAEMAKQAMRKFFPKSGGRPPTIPKVKQRVAIDAVLSKLGDGQTLAKAIESTAPEFGLSSEQLRRYWKSRKTIPRLPTAESLPVAPNPAPAASKVRKTRRLRSPKMALRKHKKQ